MHQISHLLPSKLPVRHKGCVKEALGVKYFSIVARWMLGGDCVRAWMMWGISATVGVSYGVRMVEEEGGEGPGSSIADLGESIVGRGRRKEGS